jgi:hypothetical protein
MVIRHMTLKLDLRSNPQPAYHLIQRGPRRSDTISMPDLPPNRINIDTGFATGRLTCIVVEGSAIMQLPV